MIERERALIQFVFLLSLSLICDLQWNTRQEFSSILDCCPWCAERHFLTLAHSYTTKTQIWVLAIQQQHHQQQQLWQKWCLLWIVDLPNFRVSLEHTYIYICLWNIGSVVKCNVHRLLLGYIVFYTNVALPTVRCLDESSY